MKQLQESRDIRMLAQSAIAAEIVGGATSSGTTAPLGGRSQGEVDGACDVLLRLAQMIQRMRLDPVDAPVYQDICDALARRATAISKWSQLPKALAQIMHLVEQRDYYWALVELRRITQPEWHSC